MPQLEKDIRDFREKLTNTLNANLDRILRREELRCEYEHPMDATAETVHECGGRDIIRQCSDCGTQRCRRHPLATCCGEYWCEFCLELHQTDDHHAPLAELVS